jgi:hypothetical protein
MRRLSVTVGTVAGRRGRLYPWIIKLVCRADEEVECLASNRRGGQSQNDDNHCLPGSDALSLFSYGLLQWYSTFSIYMLVDAISHRSCTRKAAGVQFNL